MPAAKHRVKAGRGLGAAAVTLTVVAVVMAALVVAGVGPLRATRAGGPGVGSPAGAAGPPQGGATTGPAPAPVAATPPTVLAAPAVDAPLPVPDLLVARVAPSLAPARLGRAVGAMVADASSGEVLLARGADTPLTPASTTKLLTMAAVLETLGPQARLLTRTVLGADPGQVVLVGGGDPTLSVGPPVLPGAARLDTLAAATAAALRQRGRTQVSLTVDDSLFTGPAVNPAWPAEYVPSGVVSPVAALAVNEGRGGLGGRRVSDPALVAGQALAAALSRAGITVLGPVRHGRAPAGATELAGVSSPVLADLVEHTLTSSDDDLAEALVRQVAVRTSRPASFSGAAKAVLAVLGSLGVEVQGITLYDGSGLSRLDTVTAAALVEVLRLAASPQHPELRPLLTGLPVAGFSGTLADRFTAGSLVGAAGLVRAKTGTLTGVSALAGTTIDAQGRLLVFAVLADQVPVTQRARAALDDFAAALTGCGCGSRTVAP